MSAACLWLLKLTCMAGNKDDGGIASQLYTMYIWRSKKESEIFFAKSARKWKSSQVYSAVAGTWLRDLWPCHPWLWLRVCWPRGHPHVSVYIIIISLINGWWSQLHRECVYCSLVGVNGSCFHRSPMFLVANVYVLPVDNSCSFSDTVSARLAHWHRGPR